jgi:hypothetical protein
VLAAGRDGVPGLRCALERCHDQASRLTACSGEGDARYGQRARRPEEPQRAGQGRQGIMGLFRRLSSSRASFQEAFSAISERTIREETHGRGLRADTRTDLGQRFREGKRPLQGAVSPPRPVIIVISMSISKFCENVSGNQGCLSCSHGRTSQATRLADSLFVMAFWGLGVSGLQGCNAHE